MEAKESAEKDNGTATAGLNIGAIIGLIVGGVVVFIVVIVLVWRKYRPHSRDHTPRRSSDGRNSTSFHIYGDRTASWKSWTGPRKSFVANDDWDIADQVQGRNSRM